MYIYMVIIGEKPSPSRELVLSEVGSRDASLMRSSHCTYPSNRQRAAVVAGPNKACCSSHTVHQVSSYKQSSSSSPFLLLGPASQALTNWEETGWNQINKYNSGFIKNQELPCCSLLALKK